MEASVLFPRIGVWQNPIMAGLPVPLHPASIFDVATACVFSAGMGWSSHMSLGAGRAYPSSSSYFHWLVLLFGSRSWVSLAITTHHLTRAFAPAAVSSIWGCARKLRSPSSDATTGFPPLSFAPAREFLCLRELGAGMIFFSLNFLLLQSDLSSGTSFSVFAHRVLLANFCSTSPAPEQS
jgi:hypothetical protein